MKSINSQESINTLQSDIIENSPVVTFKLLSSNGLPIEYLSQNISLFGYSAEELIFENTLFSSLIHPEDLEQVTSEMKEFSAQNIDMFEQEYRIISPSGDFFWVNVHNTLKRDSNGKATHYQGVFFNVTNRKKREESYQHLFEVTGTGMGIIESDETFSLLNKTVAGLLETDIPNILNSKFSDWVIPSDRERMLNYHIARLSGKKEIPENYEFQFRSKKGTLKWALVNLTFLQETKQTLVSVLDISALKKTEKALKRAVASQNAILAAVPDLMFEVDINGCFLNVWAHKPQELARNREEILGRTIREVLPSDTAEESMQAINEADERGHSIGRQIQIDTPAGKLWFELSISLKNSNDSPHQFIVLSRNVTEHKEMEKKLLQLLKQDPLTGLFNRRVLEERLNKDIQIAHRYNHPLSLFMLDIDHFKVTNDTYGHSVGDFVLEKVAKILQESIRTTDYAVRYGGEEFVIVLPETSSNTALELAHRLRINIEKSYFQIEDGDKINVTVSIGISTLNKTTNSMEGLINSADTAMYLAKDSGRNCIKTAVESAKLK